MDTSGMENQFQLAFVDLGLAVLNLTISVFVGLFQQILSSIFQGIFGLFTTT